jgi:hypothetical protein
MSEINSLSNLGPPILATNQSEITVLSGNLTSYSLFPILDPDSDSWIASVDLMETAIFANYSSEDLKITFFPQ